MLYYWPVIIFHFTSSDDGEHWCHVVVGESGNHHDNHHRGRDHLLRDGERPINSPYWCVALTFCVCYCMHFVVCCLEQFWCKMASAKLSIKLNALKTYTRRDTFKIMPVKLLKNRFLPNIVHANYDASTVTRVSSYQICKCPTVYQCTILSVKSELPF